MRSYALHRLSRLAVLAPLTAAAAACPGCGGAPEAKPEETTAQAGEALVVTSPPYRYDVAGTAIPDLGSNGVIAAAPPTATDSASVHEGTFTNGRDSNRPGATNASTWYPLAAGTDFAQFEGSPAFPVDLASAVASAGTTLDGLSDDKLKTLATVLSAFPLPIHVGPPTSVDAFYGWVPNQARWLRSQYTVTDPSTGAMKKESYADASIAEEIRERGARLYCAARRAQFAQAGTGRTSMGRQVALPVKIFGHEIDIGVIEATFALDGPQRFTSGGTNDGAQGFEVPMLVGTSITPIDGIGLPGFGELRHPLVLVNGDTEVASAVAKQWIYLGNTTICAPFCRTFPQYVYDSPKDYQTVTHADAALGQSASLTVDVPDTPIFTLGAFTLYLSGSGSVRIGDRGTAWPSSDRLISSAPYGWPPVARVGGRSPSPWGIGWSYDEEAWSPMFSLDAPVSGSVGFWLPVAAGFQGFGSNDPMLMRALADDDHHLATTTAIDLGASATGVLGFQIGFAAFTLNGKGAVHVTFAHQTDVRDGVMDVMGNGGGIPMSAVTVEPSTSTTADLTFTVTLRIQIPLPWPLDSIDETLTIVDASTGKTWGAAPWAQQNRALIATGSSYGDPTNQPWAVSHLPDPAADASSPTTYPATFNSFDTSVPACLADATPNPPTPPSVPPTATGSAPHGELCAFSGSWLVNTQIGNGTPSSWVGACADIAGHVDAILPGATDDQKACYRSALAWLCSPTSKEQDWHGQHGVAHVFTEGSPGDLGSIALQCAKAFEPVASTTTFNRIFEFGACDEGAQMLDSTSVVTSCAPPGSTPSPVSRPVCP